MALEKGTEEWMFWSDFFQFCKKYWKENNSVEWWDNFIKESDVLSKKHNSDYAHCFISAFLDLQQKRHELNRFN